MVDCIRRVLRKRLFLPELWGRYARRQAMKVENGKIVEATENELFAQYLRSDWDELFSFPEYLALLKYQGVKVVDEHADDQD